MSKSVMAFPSLPLPSFSCNERKGYLFKNSLTSFEIIFFSDNVLCWARYALKCVMFKEFEMAEWYPGKGEG